MAANTPGLSSGLMTAGTSGVRFWAGSSVYQGPTWDKHRLEGSADGILRLATEDTCSKTQTQTLRGAGSINSTHSPAVVIYIYISRLSNPKKGRRCRCVYACGTSMYVLSAPSNWSQNGKQGKEEMQHAPDLTAHRARLGL